MIHGCMKSISAATPITLTKEEHAELDGLARSTKTEHRLRPTGEDCAAFGGGPGDARNRPRGRLHEDSLADDAVSREPVSPCYSLFSPVMFGKTGNFPFSWNDLWSIFFQVLSTFPSVMVVSLRYKACDHFSTKQGYFFKVSGTLDLVTGEKELQTIVR